MHVKVWVLRLRGSIKVGTEVDFYETERGDKLQGKIIKITPTGYVVQAMERGNTKKYTFKWHDRTKAKKLLEVTMTSWKTSVQDVMQ